MPDSPVANAAGNLRKSVRKVLLGPAIFVCHAVRWTSVITVDISTGGLSVIVPEPLEIGLVCAISCDVPGEPCKQRILISGTVASCIAKDGGYRIGVHYVESDPVSKQLIQAAVERHLQQAQ